ncbi:MAG TPA: LytR C-terminal domain-containing protein [bacterium]|nr:LytR C-terminal domain-containing protein [bacterium]
MHDEKKQKSNLGKLFFQSDAHDPATHLTPPAVPPVTLSPPPADETALASEVIAKLRTVPGIGPKLAQKISVAFPTEAALNKTTVDDLSEIRGVSLKIARDIKKRFYLTPGLPSAITASIPSKPLIPPEVIEELSLSPRSLNLIEELPEEPENADPNLISLSPAQTEDMLVPASPASDTLPVTAPPDDDTEPEPLPDADMQAETAAEPVQVPEPPLPRIEPIEPAVPASYTAEPLIPPLPEKPAREDTVTQFKTFSKPEVHLSFQQGQKGKRNRSLPLVRIFLWCIAWAGLSLVIYLVLLLIANKPAETSLPPQQQTDVPGQTNNTYLQLLTFSGITDETLADLASGWESIWSQDPEPTPDNPDVPAVPDEPNVTPTEPPLITSEISVAVLNGSGIRGAANSAADLLRTANFTVAATGNANVFSYTTTEIYASADNLRKAEAVQSALETAYQPIIKTELYQNQTTDIVVIIGSR